MDTVDSFEFKQRKYMPVFPRATGRPTMYIEGYPCEDDEPMAATGFHAEQINTLSDQLIWHFEIDAYIHIGVDNFIYYREGDISKSVAPDIFVVLGAAKEPHRRSFYTWSEGAVPTAVFEFLSDATANQDRHEKVRLYMNDIGAQEYFIHQPDMERPLEFRGWRQNPLGGFEEIALDGRGGLFSEALNLWFRWENRPGTRTRLLRPYLPDGTPIPTSIEDRRAKQKEIERREHAESLAREEAARRQEAEALATQEAARRQEAEALAREETARRQEAEALASEVEMRQKEAEAEIERLRARLADRGNGSG